MMWICWSKIRHIWLSLIINIINVWWCALLTQSKYSTTPDPSPHWMILNRDVPMHSSHWYLSMTFYEWMICMKRGWHVQKYVNTHVVCVHKKSNQTKWGALIRLGVSVSSGALHQLLNKLLQSDLCLENGALWSGSVLRMPCLETARFEMARFCGCLVSHSCVERTWEDHQS